MTVLYQVSKAASIGLFLFYGLTVLVSNAMVQEFERFGLSHFRKLTGVLQVLGALGLGLGYLLPYLVVPAAGGLALLMAGGVAVRIRCGDPIADMLPAATMFVLNLFIVLYAFALPISER
ncbi:MAG: DoxX family protein [Mycobacterium sp.]|nr:DoxX family protein [Mycobacterium sp.]